MECTSWQSWANTIDYIKTELGADTNKLELSDAQIIQKIQDHVLPEFSMYDGLQKFYFMTEAHIINDVPNLLYEFKDFPYKIIKIKGKIDKATYIDYDQIFSQSLAGDVTDFLVRQNYLDMSKLAGADDTWRFMPPNKIQVTKASFSHLTNEFILDLEVVHNSPETINPGLYQEFLDLSTSYIMRAIGKIRKKFNNMTTPFGQINMNADEMIQEAKELHDRTIDDLRKTPPDQYVWDLN